MKRWLELGAISCVVILMSCGPDVSQADRDFVSLMIPHHLAGVKLLDDAAIRTNDVRLRRLVFEMQGYHHAEIDSLEAIGEAWSVEAGEIYPGSISADDFVRLSALSDSDYDVLWLTLMIDHHQGAVEISSKALSGARSVLVARIAESTQVTQIREIAVMQELLAQLVAERLEN